MLATMGAERWTRRNVEINGAEPCASSVRMEDAVAMVDLGFLSGSMSLCWDKRLIDLILSLERYEYLIHKEQLLTVRVTANADPHLLSILS